MSNWMVLGIVRPGVKDESPSVNEPGGNGNGHDSHARTRIASHVAGCQALRRFHDALCGALQSSGGPVDRLLREPILVCPLDCIQVVGLQLGGAVCVHRCEQSPRDPGFYVKVDKGVCTMGSGA